MGRHPSEGVLLPVSHYEVNNKTVIRLGTGSKASSKQREKNRRREHKGREKLRPRAFSNLGKNQFFFFQKTTRTIPPGPRPLKGSVKAQNKKRDRKRGKWRRLGPVPNKKSTHSASGFQHISRGAVITGEGVIVEWKVRDENCGHKRDLGIGVRQIRTERGDGPR